MKRVKRLILAILVLGAVALLARPAKPRQPVPPDRVEIRYWEKWTGVEAQQMQQIVDQFNQTVGKDEGIWVKYISMTSVDQKTLISTAAGVPPDVAGMWDAQVTQFAALGALEPLEAMAQAHGLTPDYYKPVYYNSYIYDQHLYALPSTPLVLALYYNKAIFQAKAAQLRAAGLDPERAPRTIDELDRYAAALDTWAGEPGRSRLISAGFIPQQIGGSMAMAPVWWGAKLYDPVARRLLLTAPEVVATFDWARSYMFRVGLQNMRQFRGSLSPNYDTPDEPFLTGRLAMVLDGDWKANYIHNLAPQMDNWHNLPPEHLAKLTRQQRRENCMWGVAPFPTAVPGVDDIAICPSDTLVIPRGSHHKKEAFEFIAFVNRQDVVEKLVSMHCKNSPLRKVSPGYIANHPNPYIEVFEALAASPHARGLPPVPTWTEVYSELNNVADQVYLGRRGADALRAAQARCQPRLDRFFERQAMRQARWSTSDTGSAELQ